MVTIFVIQCFVLALAIFLTISEYVKAVRAIPTSMANFALAALSWAAFFCLSYLPDFL